MIKPLPGPLRPALFDLFGEIPVSQRDVAVWMFKIPKFACSRRRSAWEGYVRGWNVVDKIRRFRREGRYEEIIGDEQCEFCGQLLAQDLQPLGSPAA